MYTQETYRPPTKITDLLNPAPPPFVPLRTSRDYNDQIQQSQQPYDGQYSSSRPSVTPKTTHNSLPGFATLDSVAQRLEEHENGAHSVSNYQARPSAPYSLRAASWDSPRDNLEAVQHNRPYPSTLPYDFCRSRPGPSTSEYRRDTFPFCTNYILCYYQR